MAEPAHLKNDRHYQELVSELERAEKIVDAWENDPYIPAESFQSYQNAQWRRAAAEDKLNDYLRKVEATPGPSESHPSEDHSSKSGE